MLPSVRAGDSQHMKTALITTVFNEETNIETFLDSIHKQSTLPHQFVLVDGGSTDRTFELAQGFADRFQRVGVDFRLVKRKCNISAGRNIAIAESDADVIFCTDAGCTIDCHWLREMQRPFEADRNCDVVAGNFEIGGPSIFQKSFALVGYRNKTRNNPSSRSFAFRRHCWESYPYPENLIVHEDTKLCNEWRARGFKFVFAQRATVTWVAEKNPHQLFRKYVRYSEWCVRSGDSIGLLGILQIATYVLAGLMLIVSPWAALAVVALSVSIRLARQYYRVRSIEAPLVTSVALTPCAMIVQLTLDAAVVAGTVRGFLRRSSGHTGA